MGASESTLGNIEGFQISRVIPNSPAHTANLVPFFDIITQVDGLALERENAEFFRDYVKKSINKPVVFTVFNLRIRAYREVTITPTDSWGGLGLLGCTINWETADHCLEYTWHIVDVVANSPAADNADIMAQRDYLIGMQPAEETGITMFRDTTDFHSRIEAWRSLRATNPHTPASLLLLIYDSVDNSIKEVLVDMGKSVHLGIDIANGYLHIVPSTPGTNKLPVVKKFYVASPAAQPAAPQMTTVPAPAATTAQPFPNLAEQQAPAFPAPPAPEVQPAPVHVTEAVAPAPPTPTAPAPAPAPEHYPIAPAPETVTVPDTAPAPAPAPTAPVAAPPQPPVLPGQAPPVMPAFPQFPTAPGQPQFPQFPQGPGVPQAAAPVAPPAQ